MHVKDEILARMYVLLTLLAVVPLLVAVQVVRVTLIQGAELREQGERQATSQFTIPAMRGTIVDRHGRTLAVNTARYDIAVDPTIPGYADRAPAFLDRLARTTGRSPAWYRTLVARSSSRQYARLERGIDESALDALREVDLPGLIVQSRFSRRYTYGTAAAHLLGHVDTDLHGIAGIESRYEPVLAGVDGRQSAQRDRRGVARASADGMTVEPMHGETVVLTIDLVRQAVLEEELARGVASTGAKWGTAIAMDPWTGAVLAMANVPTYDANEPGATSHAEQRNHAVTDQLEPGSTFKLVTAVAAIEEDAASLDDSLETGDGWIVLHGRTLRDTHALGTVTFRDALAHSSNVGIALVAEKLEAADFHRHARSLGFGRKTGIDLPGEVAGVLKDPKDWSGTTLTSMSRGYEIAASPLQVLVAYAALANGGTLVQPYVVAERRDVTGNVVWTASQDSLRRAFRRSTARTLIPAFEQVVTDGSARGAAVPGVRIAGKTGTARKVRDRLLRRIRRRARVPRDRSPVARHDGRRPGRHARRGARPGRHRDSLAGRRPASARAGRRPGSCVRAPDLGFRRRAPPHGGLPAPRAGRIAPPGFARATGGRNGRRDRDDAGPPGPDGPRGRLVAHLARDHAARRGLRHRPEPIPEPGLSARSDGRAALPLMQ
jgi:cell division protein FtsI (penicillin-binding protein 3)